MALKIAFGHEARVGKDTAAEFIVETYCARQLSFAEPVYDIVDYTQTRCGLARSKDRQMLTLVATLLRENDPDIFVRLLEQQLRDFSPEQSIVVSDVRYPNEFALLRKHGFVMIRVARDAEHKAELPDHESERALVGAAWDHLLVNNGQSVKAFCYEVAQLVESVYGVEELGRVASYDSTTDTLRVFDRRSNSHHEYVELSACGVRNERKYSYWELER